MQVDEAEPRPEGGAPYSALRRHRSTLVFHLALLLVALAQATAFALACPTTSEAQVSTDLPLDGRVDRVVEKLVGFGLLDDRIVALRPMSRGEARRLLAQARANLHRLDAGDRAAAAAILESLPPEALDGDVHVDLSGTATLLDSPWLPAVSRLGEIDAEVNHLARYRGGRGFADGGTLAGELFAGAVLQEHLAVQLDGRGLVTRRFDGEIEGDRELHEANARAQLGNTRLDVGRSRSVWGFGRKGGTLLTDNARALDRIRLSSDSPFRWPGFLDVLGPSRAEVFFGVLEEDRDIPRSKLVGYAISVRPHPLVEAHFSTLIQSGGSGAPDATAWQRIADHLLLVDWIFNGGETFLFSNKGTSVGFRVRVPPLRHSQLFAEFTLEDKAHDLLRLFWQDAAWHVGAWVPRLDEAGVFDLRVELHHGGVRFHRHGQFTSGRTVDGRILGMGDAASDGGFVEIGARNARGRISLQVAVENRSADRWRGIPRPDGGLQILDKIEDGPDELYARAVAELTAYLSEGTELALMLGGQRVGDSRFQDGAVRWDGLVELGVRIPLVR